MTDIDYNTYNATAQPWANQEYVTASMSPLVIGWTADIGLSTTLIQDQA